MSEMGVSSARPARASGGLWIAVAIALSHTSWAVFQWLELVVARRGGQVVCGPGGGHCAEVWDSPFASAVHSHTGLPVAAWGVAWGLVAIVLPLVANVRLARRRVAEPWLAGTLVTAGAGVLGVVTLLTASLMFGHLCTTCGLTYLFVLAYAAVCFWAISLPPVANLGRALPLAAGLLAVAYAILFVPAHNTPQNMSQAGAKAIESLAPSTGGPVGADDREIVAFIASLPADAKQLLSDTLAAYSASPVVTPPPARSVIGPQNPRLKLVEWSDTLCGHCAQMHELLLQLRSRFGPDAFSLEPHQYPLDPSCNSGIKRDESEPLRCLAARVQICTEGKPGAFEFVGSLFENQTSLTEDKLWQLAQTMGPRADLEACARSPETDAKLQSDIAWAAEHGIKGTPLMLVNGRQAVAFPPLFYVLALSRGAASHPAYAALPPPQPLPWEK
jgi:serine/threonine-protein kinase